MTDQHHSQSIQQPAVTQGAAGDEELGQRWAEFCDARARLAEVMSDDELRAFGINIDVLDERL